eukprot:7915376-Pyramimonas_sp.AAC.1
MEHYLVYSYLWRLGFIARRTRAPFVTERNCRLGAFARTPTGIFSLPFYHWCLLWVYSLSPSTIGVCYGCILSPLLRLGSYLALFDGPTKPAPAPAVLPSLYGSSCHAQSELGTEVSYPNPQ